MLQWFNTRWDIHVIDCCALTLCDTSRIKNGLLATVVTITFSCVDCPGLNCDCTVPWHLSLASSSVSLRLSVFNSKVGITILPLHGGAVKIK